MIGVRYKGDQKFDITRALLSDVVANFRKRDTGELPVDYDHGSLTAAGQPAPAAGWIKAIDGAPDASGVLWGDVEWTDRASHYIAAKEYKYISPVLAAGVDNKTGQPQGWTLLSAALTNTPVLQGMPALILSERQWTEGGRITMSDQAFQGVPGLFPPPSGYADQDWNPVALEIDRRAKALVENSQRTARPLSYQEAVELVYQADNTLAQRNFDAIQVEIARRVKDVQARYPRFASDYGGALSTVLSQDGLLRKNYRAAQIRVMANGRGAFTVQPADSEVASRAKELLAASEGKMDFAGAMNQVLRTDPELAARYRDSFRGGPRR